MRAAIRYEFRMATRRKVLWFAVLPLLAMGVFLQAVSGHEVDSAAGRLGAWALTFNLLVIVGLGVALADRFRGSGNEVLLATPTGLPRRMLGSLIGSLAAALAPVAVVLLAVGIVLTVTTGELASAPWAVVAFVTVTLPAAVALTTAAATLGLVLPVAVARVLVVVGWFWATLFNSSIVPVPTITGTLLSPLGDYAAAGLLDTPTLWAGEGSFAAPAPSAVTAVVNLAVVVAMSAAFFVTSCALARRRL